VTQLLIRIRGSSVQAAWVSRVNGRSPIHEFAAAATRGARFNPGAILRQMLQVSVEKQHCVKSRDRIAAKPRTKQPRPSRG